MHLSQLHTILWLRWRVTRNQWSRSGRLSAAITIVVMVLLLIVGSIGGFAGLLVGVFALGKVSPGVILGVWDGTVGAFLVFWLVGILSDIQRSETIDISKMLHLPVSLRGIFILNYLASHVTACILVFVPWMMGLSVGLAVSRGWAMLWLLPLVLGFILMITAWTYLLRGWLVMLMQNPRRYRMIVGGITLVFILLSQLPILLPDASHKHDQTSHIKQMPPEEQQKAVQTHRQREERAFSTLLWLHSVVPVLWVGNGAMRLAGGSVWPAALSTVGALGLAGLGLGRAYRSTRRFYEGRSIKAKTRKRKQAVVTGRTLLERTLPGVPDEAAVLALATFRSMTRATEVKLATASNLLWLVIFGGMLLFRRSGPIGTGAQPFIATAAAVLPFCGMAQLLLNPFGFDRTGFRALVLSPVPRWQILLGKNLALLPFTMGIGLTLLLIARLALHIPWLVVLAACLQSLIAFLILSMLGNLVSPLLPCRIAPGALKPSKLPTVTANILFILCHMSFSAAVTPVFLPPVAGWLFASAGWLPAAPTNLLFSAIELSALIALYWLTLPHFGHLLQRREKEILRIVTQEVE